MSDKPQLPDAENCRFCQYDACYVADTESSYYFVKCENCGATGPLEDTEAEAVTAWNTRQPNERLREAVRELLCQRCDREYPVWFCPNDLWNAVQREGEHFFCPTCFAILAEERGIEPTGWILRAENDEDRALQHELATLREQNEKLVAALEHYADRGNWDCYFCHSNFPHKRIGIRFRGFGPYRRTNRDSHE